MVTPSLPWAAHANAWQPFQWGNFPNIQSKPPLVQFEGVSSCPITCYLGEETNTHSTTSSFQVAVESKKVSPQPPLLQTKQHQFPQPLLVWLVLQTLHQPRCSSLDALQHINVFLVGGAQNWTQYTSLIFQRLALMRQHTLYMINTTKVNNNIFDHFIRERDRRKCSKIYIYTHHDEYRLRSLV